MSSLSFKSGVTVALAATTLLGLAACSDPGAAAASGTTAAPSSSGVKQFNLSPQQDRIPVTEDAAAAALVPDAVKKDGKLTVAVSPFAAPLAVYATDNKTPVGNEVDLAVALAQTLGLEADIVPTAWADWPLGVDSGKYEAVLSNVTVTEERKLKFDFASYREDKLGFYAKADSNITKVESAPDVAGKRVIVGSGTNQEAILLRWDEENKKNGLAARGVPVFRRRLRLPAGHPVRPRGPHLRPECHGGLQGRHRRQDQAGGPSWTAAGR